MVVGVVVEVVGEGAIWQHLESVVEAVERWLGAILQK